MTNWLVIKSWFIVFRENYWKSINENTVWFMKKNDFFYHIIINMIHYQHIVFVTGSTIWKKGHHWNTNLKCLNHLKTEKHYHYRFQEFHLGFQKDPPPPSTFINCSLLSLIQKLFLRRFSLKEFIIMLLNMTTVPLNNWGFTHKVKKP